MSIDWKFYYPLYGKYSNFHPKNEKKLEIPRSSIMFMESVPNLQNEVVGKLGKKAGNPEKKK